jgi:hypothetical protein
VAKQVTPVSHRFGYRESWLTITGLGAIGAVGIGGGAYQLGVGYPCAPPLAGPVAGVPLVCLGMLFAGLALWLSLDRLLRWRSIVVSEQMLTLPRSRWSLRMATVPLEEIISIRTIRVWNGTLLEIVASEGRYTIPPAMLPGADDSDRLRKLLAERAGERALAQEGPAEREGHRPFRPQFSLAGLFFVVTLVAVMLGTHRYVYGGYSSDTLLDVAAALAVLVGGLWLAAEGGRLARAFFLGFAIGYFFEVLAAYAWLVVDRVRFAPGSSTPQNWYPLTFALGHLAERLPQTAKLFVESHATLFGGLVSGLACGSAAMLVRLAASRARRRRSRGVSVHGVCE